MSRGFLRLHSTAQSGDAKRLHKLTAASNPRRRLRSSTVMSSQQTPIRPPPAPAHAHTPPQEFSPILSKQEAVRSKRSPQISHLTAKVTVQSGGEELHRAPSPTLSDSSSSRDGRKSETLWVTNPMVLPSIPSPLLSV